MRLILDANQASAIREVGTFSELVLPTYVLAEILLHPDPSPILQKLAALSPKLGLEPAAVLDAIAIRNEAGIRNFEPFASSDFVYSAKTFGQARALHTPQSGNILSSVAACSKKLRNCGRKLSAPLR
jgi:hypothetical protein